MLGAQLATLHNLHFYLELMREIRADLARGDLPGAGARGRRGLGVSVSTAWAQTGEASGPPPLYNIGFIVLMFAIFYFVLLRPEQRRRKEQDALVAAVKRNDQVVLSSGIHGRVVALGDKLVTVEIAPKVQVQVDRSAIQTVENLPSRRGAREGAGEVVDEI